VLNKIPTFTTSGPVGSLGTEILLCPPFKLYRYTNSNYTGGTLIYTGTAGTYVDTGLTPDTIYYYKLFPVISGVDTEARITFSCITMK